MQAVFPQPFDRISFSRQFMLLTLGILVTSLLVVGIWLERQFERSAANRAAASAAIYVEGILSEQLAGRSPQDLVGSETREALRRLFVEGPLSHRIVRFKLWGPDGLIVFSSDDVQVGQRFPMDGLRAAAFAGEVQARLSTLDQVDNSFERRSWKRLLEVYVPVFANPDGGVTAVAEFYHSAQSLAQDIRSAQIRGWSLVVVTTAAAYLLLLRLVRRANNTIVVHQRELGRQLEQLRAALVENERMRGQLRQAGARTTALNEQFLHRIAADLHDGPAQDAALALLRLDALAEVREACGSPRPCPCSYLEVAHNAMHSCLNELRQIASGLYMPEIGDLSLADTARRAVRDFERKSGTRVHLDMDRGAGAEPVEAPLAVKITVYRLIQEALANGWRHAEGCQQQVWLSLSEREVLVEVRDQGPGFDYQAASLVGGLGLAFMNERVRLLGGIFEVDSAPGRGTRVRARLPLCAEDSVYG